MRGTVVILTIAAMLLCIIPLADSSEATDATTVSGYLYEGSKDISTASNIYICIIYSDDGGTTGKIVGHTNTLGPLSEKKTNRFSITIEPEADLTITHYYLYFNIYGYSVSAMPDPSMAKKDKITIGGITYNNCYNLSGSDIVVGTDNIIGSAESGWIIMSGARGTVSGKVSINTQEPTYLTGVKVTLFDLETKEDIKDASDVTDNNGYSITYNTGTYGIRFEMSGYDTVTDEVTIIENADVQLPVTMKQNQSYFGLDLPHALMILGGAVALILVLFAVIRRARLP